MRRDPGRVDALGVDPREPRLRGHGQGLDLDEEDARALVDRGDRRAGRHAPPRAGRGRAPRGRRPPRARPRPSGRCPTSSALPKRFLLARRTRSSPSPCSKPRTASTRCSAALGPAMRPSFVTWATRMMAASRSLAQAESSWAQYLIWLAVPGTAPASSAWRVWIESITAMAGLESRRGRRGRGRGRPSRRPRGPRAGRRAGRPSSRIWAGRLLARDVEDASLVSALAQSWRRRVLLPMPGSPPMRIAEPRMRPPPRTRSTSRQAVRMRAPSPDRWRRWAGGRSRRRGQVYKAKRAA